MTQFPNRADAATESWSPASIVSESPTREGSPQLTEMKPSSGEPSGGSLLTYFRFGQDGISRIAQRVSTDGINWSSEKAIPGTENGLDPAAAQLPDGEVIVVYAHYLLPGQEIEVDMVRSSDLVNWTAPRMLATAHNGTSAFVPDITVLASGRIVVAYTRGVEQINADPYLIVSDDNGSTWSQPRLIYGGPEYDSRAQIIGLPSGELLAAFYTSPAFPPGSGIPRRGDILAMRSADGGLTWQGPVVISAETGRDECWVSLLDRGAGEIWAAFTVDEGDRDPARPPGIRLSKSYDAGRTWASPQALDAGGRRLTWPALAAQADGSAVLVADDNAWYGSDSRSYWSLWQWNTANKTLQPASKMWNWYDSLNGRNWLLSANLGSEPVYQQTSISGAPMGAGWVWPGKLNTNNYPGIMAGPVALTSLTGRDEIASQRMLWGPGSFEELPAADASRLDNTWYWPWYDQSTPGFVADWVMLSNPNGFPVYYRITIDGQPAGPGDSGTIGAGQTVSQTFPGKIGGMVQASASADAGGTAPANITASQRVLSANGSAFNELAGISSRSLAASYVWPWYDDVGGKDWVVVANPNTQSISYQIELNGGCHGAALASDQACLTGSIAPGAEFTPRLEGRIGGPLQVTTWFDSGQPADSIASERTLWGPSFEELPGQPLSGIGSRYDWPWYDMKSPGVANWVLIVNPNSSQISYQISIDGTVMPNDAGNPGVIPAHGRVAAMFPGVMAGPLEVTSAGGGVVASQRVLWNGYFNEVLGTAMG